MLRGIVLSLAFALVAVPAHAGQLSLLGAGKGSTAGGYSGPGDIVSGAQAWYGLRAYSGAVAATGTQKSVRLRRTSDSTETDILILTTGAVDTATASTFCNATTCFVTTFYDQSGNGFNATQTTAANQPAFIFSCLGANPCLRVTATVQTMAATPSATTSPQSFSAVAKRTSGTVGTVWIGTSALANRIGAQGAAANTWNMNSGGCLLNRTANEGTWNAANGVVNGASSVFNVNSSEVTGTCTLDTASNSITVAGNLGSAPTGDLVEAGVWNNVAFSAGNRTALNTQQHAAYGGF